MFTCSRKATQGCGTFSEAGLPVPQGFTITTEACTRYYDDGRQIGDDIMEQIKGGVAFTRDPATGEKRLMGEFLLNAQDEDVVAGIRTLQKIDRLKELAWRGSVLHRVLRPDRSGLCVLLAVPRADRAAVGSAGFHPGKGSVKYRLHGTAGCRSVLISRHSLKNAGSENFRVFIEERTGRKFKKPGSILTFNIHDLISLFRK